MAIKTTHLELVPCLPEYLLWLCQVKSSSYRVAHRDVMPLVTHDTTQYANNRAEVSHQPTRQRERQMRGFTSPGAESLAASLHRRS